MSFSTLKIVLLTEVRIRLRRLSTLVTLLAMIVLAWMVFEDPATGSSLLVVEGARVLYTSSALALASVTLFGMLFSMAGFYLVRGRISEDVRCGLGGVIGASKITNSLFLFGRWLGGVSYLFVLSMAFMLSIMVCQVFRGVGPIEPLIYLQTYALILLPLICFTVSGAILFDSIASLMGKLGDVIYFFIWVSVVAQLGLMGEHLSQGSSVVSALMILDFYGLASCMQALNTQLHTANIALGMAVFDPHLAPITLRAELWSAPLIVVRALSTLLAACLALPAVWLFHRYSSDKVKFSQASVRRSPLGVLNAWLRPLSGLARPIFTLALKAPGVLGQALADIAVILMSAPSAMLALVLVSVFALFTPIAHVNTLLLPATAIWGILISDFSTRDFVVGCEDMTGVVLGGVSRRYLRYVLTSVLLGLLFVGVIVVKMAFSQPFLLLELLIGLLSLSAVAALLGRTSRTSRLFLALFLFWLYIATQVPRAPELDILAFNGVANGVTMLSQLIIALIALFSGYLYNNRER